MKLLTSLIAAALPGMLVLCGMTGCGPRETQGPAASVQVAAGVSAGIAPEPVPVPGAAPEPASDPAPAADAPKQGPGRTAADPPPRSGVPLRYPRPAGPIFDLPTANDALFRNDPASFYMFVDRYGADGKVSQVWQGGGYGYVRNPRNTANGEVFTKFHEGIDIAPMERDAAGEPLDIVHAIADGTVVFCAPNAASNYGNYVVIEHRCGAACGNFYSLYAHLSRIDTTAGTALKRGQALGRMGHTGEGIDRRRSHVHLELCLLLSEHFNDYYAIHYKLGNPNGNWHGYNLIGLDVAAFLKAARADPGLTPADFLKTAEPYFRVRLPNKTGGELDIVRRYPWLRRPGDASLSWEITYNAACVPLSVAPSTTASSAPSVSWVKTVPGYHSWNTRNHLGGSGATATLAPEGARYQQLVSGDF